MNMLDIVWNMVELLWYLRKVLLAIAILMVLACLYLAGSAPEVSEDYEEDISGTPPTKTPQTWGGAQA